MKKFTTWYMAQPDKVKALLIFLATITMVVLWTLIVMALSGQRARKLMEPYAVADRDMGGQVAAMKAPEPFAVNYFKTLKAEQTVLNIRKLHHFELSVTFFRTYYAILILKILLSCLGGVLLFVLVNKGWSTAGISLQALFMSIAGVLAFFNVFPLVFQHEKNLQANMISYLNYSKAEVDIVQQLSILSNPATSAFVKADSTETPVFRQRLYFHVADSMISANTKRINDLLNYSLTIAPGEIQTMSEIVNFIKQNQTALRDSLPK